MWPSKYAAQKLPLFLRVVAHSHHCVAAVSFDCTQQNRFINKYENLYMCPEIRRIFVFHVQRLYFFPQFVSLAIWSTLNALYLLSLHVCILVGLLCTHYCFWKHKVHVVVLKWNLIPLYVMQASLACLHESQFGCSSRSESRLALFVLAQRRRHISLVDTPLLQGSYCGVRGPGQQRLNSQFAVISLNLLVHCKYQCVRVSGRFFSPKCCSFNV